MTEPKNLKPASQRNTTPNITLLERLHRLQQWLSDCDTCRTVSGCELSIAEYERAHGWTSHTIERLLKDREMLEAVDPEFANKRRRAVKRPFYPVEVVLVDLIKDIRSRHVPVDTLLLRALAQDVYTVLESRMGFMPFPRPAFGGSWVESFKKAWGLDFHKTKGEAGSVDLALIAGDVERLKTIIADYPLEDVYNADETGLFLQALSPWTLDFGRQPGTKSSSTRVSILFCVNSTGTDKRKPFVLSSSLPNGFKTAKGASLRSQVDVLPWKPAQDAEQGWGSGWRDEVVTKGKDRKKRTRTQRPDYMNAEAFLAWLRHTHQDITAKDPDRRILLLVDNCRAHTVAMQSHKDFSSIRIEGLPPNSTSVTQPLDAGVIADFKRRYRHHVASRAYENSLRTGDRAEAKVSNFEGWELIVRAWKDVKPMSIRDCFAHVPILDDVQKKELRTEDRIDPDIYNAITDAFQDMTIRASMMDQDPLKTLERTFPGSSGVAFFQSTQTTNLTAECIRTERDYYTQLSTLLDGSTFLNDIITEQKKNRSFMQCFDVEERTVPLDELCPDDDDTDDEDYGLDSTTTQQPETSILSPDTHVSPQGTPGSNSATASLPIQTAIKAEEDMLVSTNGAMFLASETSTAPHGSKKRDLQTRKQSYSWHVGDLCSSDISDPDFYQYDEDESLDESGSEDERIDVFHRAAKHLQGDEYKTVRHALDVAAEKLVSPAIGFPPPGFAKEYRSRQRKRMLEVHKLAEDDQMIQEKFAHAFKIQRLDLSHDQKTE